MKTCKLFSKGGSRWTASLLAMAVAITTASLAFAQLPEEEESEPFYSIIEVTSFEDINKNGVWDQGEAALPDGQFELYTLQGDEWLYLESGTADSDGRVVFS